MNGFPEMLDPEPDLDYEDRSTYVRFLEANGGLDRSNVEQLARQTRRPAEELIGYHNRCLLEFGSLEKILKEFGYSDSATISYERTDLPVQHYRLGQLRSIKECLDVMLFQMRSITHF